MNKYCTKGRDSEQPLSENHGSSQTNDSECFRCNVTKMQGGDFLRESFVVVFVTYRHKWLTENSR